MRPVVAAFIVTRAALALTLLGALATFTPAQCPFCTDTSTNALLAALTRWDAAAYIDIARHGYTGAADPTNAAYWPLYPLLTRVGGLALGGSVDAYIVSGLIVANVALIAALVALVRLATERVGSTAAVRSALYLLVFPTTVVLSATYAESLFLALAVGSALFAQRRRWWWSGVLATLAALTRPFGMLAIIPLAFALWTARTTAPRVAWLAILGAPAAFLTWVGYLYAISGDPLRFMHVYAAWGASARTPLDAFTDLFDRSVYGFPWFTLVFFVAFVALTVASWRIAGPDLGALATALLLVLASSGSLTSSMRYELAMFPAFITFGALVRTKIGHLVWIVASTVIALVFTSMYALWLWIG